MDPYLEDPSVWGEFRYVLIAECMYLLSDRLPPPYVAKIQERVQALSITDDAAERYVPDVAVARDRRDPPPAPAISGGATAVAAPAARAPVTIPAVDTIELREGYIEIQRLPDYDLVTSIEILSPWNKFGEGIGEYRHKRRALLARGVHVVEIDLLRRGTRTELARPLPRGDYYGLVFRADRRPDVQVFHWGVRGVLPAVPVPLRAPDSDVSLELSAAAGAAYDRARYDRKLRYDRAPPAPPLSREDAAWTTELLGAAGRQ
jgi:hypothetical protein